jgi:signal transduction histidine kinase
MPASVAQRRPALLVDPNALALRVSARTRAERARRSAQRAGHVAERDRRRGDAIASASHELRTPLASIVGYSEVLLAEEAGPLTADQARMLERVSASAEQLAFLAELLLRAIADREGPPDLLVGDLLDRRGSGGDGVEGGPPPQRLGSEP